MTFNLKLNSIYCLCILSILSCSDNFDEEVIVSEELESTSYMYSRRCTCQKVKAPKSTVGFKIREAYPGHITPMPIVPYQLPPISQLPVHARLMLVDAGIIPKYAHLNPRYNGPTLPDSEYKEILIRMNTVNDLYIPSLTNATALSKPFANTYWFYHYLCG